MNWPTPKRISTRIAVMSLTIVLLASVLTTGFGLYYTLGESRKNATSRVSLYAEKSALALEGFIGTQMGYLEGQARALVVSRDFSQSHLARFTKSLVEGNSYAAYAYFCTLTDDGHFTSSDGWIPPEDYTWQDKPWIQKTAQSERILFDEPSYDSVTQKIVTVLRKRIAVSDERGVIVEGILVMALDLNRLSDHMGAMQLPKDFKTVLIDSKGNAIQYGDPTLLVNQDSATPIATLLPGFQRLSDGFTLGDTAYIGRRMNFSDWKLYIEYPLQYIYRDTLVTIGAYTGIFFVVWLVALLATRRLSQQLTKPLRVLTEQVRMVSKGDYHRDFNLVIRQRADELGDLSRDFDQMRQEISRRTLESEYKSNLILHMNAELENKIAERTIELTAANQELEATLESLTELQAQLIQSQRMASLGNVVSAMAHEINTPLGTLFTGISMIEGQLDHLQSHYHKGQMTRTELEDFLELFGQWLPQYHRTYQRLQGLLDTFMLLSGQYVGEGVQHFNVVDVIKDLLALKEPAKKGPEGSFRLVAPEALVVKGIPMVYYLVMEKLIDNVFAHGRLQDPIGSREGDALGVIDLTVVDNQLRLCIQDYGPGFQEQMLENGFEPFVTTKRDLGHLGLGLSVVYSLVHEVLGGDIELRNRQPQGAQVTILLPLSNEERLSQEAPE